MFLPYLKTYWRKRAGATAIEYALIACGISLVIVSVVTLIGGDLNGMFTVLETALGTANSNAAALAP